MNFRRYLIELNDKQKLVKGGTESFELFLNYINTMPKDIKKGDNVEFYIEGTPTNGNTISKEEAIKLFTGQWKIYENLYKQKKKEVNKILRQYPILRAELKATDDPKEKTRIRKKLRRIKRLVETLPEEQQKIICLKYFNHMRTDNLASYLGTTAQKANSMLATAREKLTDYYMFKGDE